MQILDLGHVVVVADEDAGAAELAATEIRQRGERGERGQVHAAPICRTAVFVLEPSSAGPSPGLREFCREQFGMDL